MRMGVAKSLVRLVTRERREGSRGKGVGAEGREGGGVPHLYRR